MFRAGFVALSMCVWGAPMFDGTRPQLVDRALRSFNGDVSAVLLEVRLGVDRLQYSPPGRYLARLRDKYWAPRTEVVAAPAVIQR